MKFYTLTFNANLPTKNQLNIPTNTDYKIGVKVVRNGELLDLDPADVTLGALSADADKTNGYVTFTTAAGDDSSYTQKSLVVDSDSVDLKFDLVENIFKSQQGDIGLSGGGGDVPADVATKSWVNSQISDFVEEDALTAYATKDELTAYAETTDLTAYAEKTDLTAYYTKSETSSATEIGTALAGKQPTGNYLTAETEPAFAAMSADIVVDGDLTAFYTKSETSSATEIADTFASKVTGGAETGTTGTPAAITAVKSVYETDWATLSATAVSSTFYVVLPDPA